MKGIKGLILLLLVVCKLAYSAEPYMVPYKDTMIIMTHGINSDRYTWGEPTDRGEVVYDDPNHWGGYLTKKLSIPIDYIKSYSFSKKSGFLEQNILEFGAGVAKNQASDPEAEANESENGIDKKSGITDENSWLEQARYDYRNMLFNDTDINPQLSLWSFAEDIPKSLLPEKLVVLAHSQGNFAIRGYLQSGSLAKDENAFHNFSVPHEEYHTDIRGLVGLTKTIPPIMTPDQLTEIKENTLGFYDWPVEKVVFFNSVLNGAGVRAFGVHKAFGVLVELAKADFFPPFVADLITVAYTQLVFSMNADSSATDEEAFYRLPVVQWLFQKNTFDFQEAHDFALIGFDNPKNGEGGRMRKA
jgi:hypothetical protein